MGSIAALALISALTITPEAILNTPALVTSISPEGFTEVATPEPFPIRIFPSERVASFE